MGYDLIICEWNKFHPYNMNRAYGSSIQMNEIPADQSRRDGAHIVATDFNPWKMNDNHAERNVLRNLNTQKIYTINGRSCFNLRSCFITNIFQSIGKRFSKATHHKRNSPFICQFSYLFLIIPCLSLHSCMKCKNTFIRKKGEHIHTEKEAIQKLCGSLYFLLSVTLWLKIDNWTTEFNKVTQRVSQRRIVVI